MMSINNGTISSGLICWLDALNGLDSENRLIDGSGNGNNLNLTSPDMFKGSHLEITWGKFCRLSNANGGMWTSNLSFYDYTFEIHLDKPQCENTDRNYLLTFHHEQPDSIAGIFYDSRSPGYSHIGIADITYPTGRDRFLKDICITVTHKQGENTKLYVDGVLAAQGTAVRSTLCNFAEFIIGKQNTVEERYTEMKLYSIRLYNRSLSPEEVLSNYYQEKNIDRTGNTGNISYIFPDPVVAEHIRQLLSKSSINDIVTQAELDTITYFGSNNLNGNHDSYFIGKTVTTWEGIERLRNVTRFKLQEMAAATGDAKVFDISTWHKLSYMHDSFCHTQGQIDIVKMPNSNVIIEGSGYGYLAGVKEWYMHPRMKLNFEDYPFSNSKIIFYPDNTVRDKSQILWHNSNGYKNVTSSGLMFDYSNLTRLEGNAPKTPVTDGMYVWLDGVYGINSEKTGTWKDRSTNGSDGTLLGFAFDDTSGWTGSALRFKQNNAITIGRTISTSEGFTVFFRIMNARLQDDPVLAATNFYIYLKQIGTASYGRNKLSIKNGTSAEFDIPCTTLDGAYALSFDNAAGSVKLYFNGKLIAEKTGVQNMNTSLANINIGRNLVWGDSFVGDMQSMYIYNRALSSDEVKHNYSYELAKLNPGNKQPLRSFVMGMNAYMNRDGKWRLECRAKNKSSYPVGLDAVQYEDEPDGSCVFFDVGRDSSSNNIAGKITTDGKIYIGEAYDNLIKTLRNDAYIISERLANGDIKITLGSYFYNDIWRCHLDGNVAVGDAYSFTLAESNVTKLTANGKTISVGNHYEGQITEVNSNNFAIRIEGAAGQYFILRNWIVSKTSYPVPYTAGKVPNGKLGINEPWLSSTHSFIVKNWTYNVYSTSGYDKFLFNRDASGGEIFEGVKSNEVQNFHRQELNSYYSDTVIGTDIVNNKAFTYRNKGIPNGLLYLSHTSDARRIATFEQILIYEGQLTQDQMEQELNKDIRLEFADTNAYFLDSEGLRHLTSKIKDTIPSLSTGLPVPYTPELALNGGLTCVYTGKKPIGYEKLNSGNCRPDGTFDADTDIAGQILEDGSIWFGVETENLLSNSRMDIGAGYSGIQPIIENGISKISAGNGDRYSYKTKNYGELIDGRIFTNSIYMSCSPDWNKNVTPGIRTYWSNDSGWIWENHALISSQKDGTFRRIYATNPAPNGAKKTTFFLAFSSNTVDTPTGACWFYNGQQEEKPFPTPWVEKTRKQTKLVYPIEVTGSLYNKYAVYCEIDKNQNRNTGDINLTNGHPILCTTGEDESGTNSIHFNYGSPNGVSSKFYNLLSDGLNKVIFINNTFYINGTKFTGGIENRGGVQSGNTIYIFSPNKDSRTWNMPFKKIILFQDKTPFTEDYCKLATTIGFDIPKCKETAPLYNTDPDTTGLLKYKESYRINDNSETFPIKPNCVYKMTDRNGKEFINKTNASNVISAGADSALIITNTAGEGKINTGTGYEYPIKVEAVIN